MGGYQFQQTTFTTINIVDRQIIRDFLHIGTKCQKQHHPYHKDGVVFDILSKAYACH